MTGIYAIRNKTNGKVYVGQSVNILQRWRSHRARSKQPNHIDKDLPVYRALTKYGIDNFEFIILEECDKEQLNEREIYWIKYYDSYNNGYNATLGGGNNKNIGVKLSEKEVEEIQYLLINTNKSQKEIANKYDLAQSNISQINTGEIWYNEDLDYPLRKYPGGLSTPQKQSYCIDCGVIITKGAVRCIKCHTKNVRKAEWPTREELKHLIRTTPFTRIGEKFGVSDNAVRNWCKNYNLPRRAKDIKVLSDEEWVEI